MIQFLHHGDWQPCEEKAERRTGSWFSESGKGGGNTLLGKGFSGIKDDEYNVVFWRE
jgi:hypothetical protein